jgi:predicted PurR-regulated permease PerM
MDDRMKPYGVVAFTLGALTGLALAIFALIFRRSRRSSPVSSTDSIYLDPYQPTFNASSLAAAPMPSGSIGTLPATRGPRWTAPTKYIMGVILFLGALVVVIIGRGVIPMVILAALLALFINPLIDKLNRRFRISWSVATAIAYIGVVIILFLGFLILIPSLLDAINYLISQDYQALAGQAADAINSFFGSLQNNPTLHTLANPILSTIAQALENFSNQEPAQPANVEVTIYTLSSYLGERLGILFDILGPVVGIVAGGIVILFMALQMSLAANQISGWYPDLIPSAYKEEYSTLFDRITKTWISFLRGQITLMIIIGLVTWLGGIVLGVPYALLMGLLAGLLELIPNIGPTLAAIPAVILALLFGSTYLPVENLPFALIVVAFYVLVQLVENQFIVPYVMGDAVDLPPLIVLIGAIAGAYAFGILGALLATPVIATGNLIFRFVYRKILEPPPIPVPVEAKPSFWDSLRGWTKRLQLTRREMPVDQAVKIEDASSARVDMPNQGVGARTEIDDTKNRVTI